MNAVVNYLSKKIGTEKSSFKDLLAKGIKKYPKITTKEVLKNFLEKNTR